MKKKLHLLATSGRLVLYGLITQTVLTTASYAGNDTHAPSKDVNKNSLNELVQSIPVSGKVVSEDGEPLPGVNVVIKNTNTGTITDMNGEFSLNVPSAETVLVFSFIGYNKQEVRVGSQTSISIKLLSNVTELEEMIIVGYAVQKKANLTGSVATVEGKTLTERPAPNSANLLQGRMPGVQVTQPSAEPGRDNPNILIRGRATFGGSNEPLILIDGVVGHLQNLAPDDIESITVLKDAASASIYGSRAANGVILVTTKKGKKGQPTRVNYTANFAQHRATSLPDFITNSAEYMEMYNQAAERSGVAFRYPQTEIDKYKHATDREQFPNFDAMDYWFRPALVQNHNLSMNGGGEKNTFNLSLGFLDQEAMLPGYKFQRYNALLNYTHEINKVVSVGTIMNLTYKDQKEPPFTSSNLALAVYATGPLYGPYLPDGSGRVVSRAYNAEGRNRNPAEYYIMGNQRTQNYNLNSQAFIDVKPLPGLTWTTKVAVNYEDQFYKMHQQPYDAFLLQEMDPNTGDYRRATFGPDVPGVTDMYRKWITPTVYSTVNYIKSIGNHNMSFLGGYEQIYHNHRSIGVRRLNGVSPRLTEITGYTPEGQVVNPSHPRLPGVGSPEEWALQSLFGRAAYNYKEKYFIETNLRYDGTSRVSPGYRWGFFPSMSAGWTLSEENFIKDNLSWLDHLKLRGSVGTLGNQSIGTYAYQDNLVINNIFYPFGNTLTQGAVLNQFRDQSLRWESSRITNIGFDLDIFKGLFGVSVERFNNRTYNILSQPPVPMSLGLSATTLNDGEMKSWGTEVEVRHRNKIGEISYGGNFMISTARNEVVHIATPSFGNTIRDIGHPFDAHFLYEWDGIFQTEDIGNPNVPYHEANPNPRPGDLKMKDQNGDGVIDADDRIVVPGVYPDFMYSFAFDVSYKRWSLNAFFQGVEGSWGRFNGWGVDPFNQGTPPTTKWREAWTPENPTNELPALYIAGYQGVANYTNSTYYLMNTSYLRLKNIMLSYNVPQALCNKLKMQHLRIYTSADNLITWTQFEGSDPERTSTSGNYATYPQARIFNLGLNVQF